MLRDLANAKKMNEVVTEILLFYPFHPYQYIRTSICVEQIACQTHTTLKPIKTFQDAFILSLALSVVRGI